MESCCCLPIGEATIVCGNGNVIVLGRSFPVLRSHGSCRSAIFSISVFLEGESRERECVWVRAWVKARLALRELGEGERVRERLGERVLERVWVRKRVKKRAKEIESVCVCLCVCVCMCERERASEREPQWEAFTHHSLQHWCSSCSRLAPVLSLLVCHGYLCAWEEPGLLHGC